MSFSVSGDKDVEILRDFGLATNQAKVYLAIARLGLASVVRFHKHPKYVAKMCTESSLNLKNWA